MKWVGYTTWPQGQFEQGQTWHSLLYEMGGTHMNYLALETVQVQANMAFSATLNGWDTHAPHVLSDSLSAGILCCKKCVGHTTWLQGHLFWANMTFSAT